MSYSFSGIGRSKQEAKDAICEELAKVLARDAMHRKDVTAAGVAAHAYIDMLPEPKESEVVSFNMGGSLTWEGQQSDGKIIGSSVSFACGVGPAVKFMSGRKPG